MLRYAYSARSGSVRSGFLFTLLGFVATLSGCGGPKPVVGGTPGTLRAGGETLAEVQITVHQNDGGAFRPIGFAVTDGSGGFKLFENGAKGPLQLQAGVYHFTLESAGSPLKFPPALTKPESTPLRVAWPTSDAQLSLEVPFRLSP